MKILYIHQYFVTPEEHGATRSYWFAKKLVAEGHEVTVVSSVTNSTRRSAGTHNIDGINVIYLSNKYSNTMSIAQKALSALRFMLKALFFTTKVNDVDLVFATSTPLSVGIIALWLRLLGRRFIFEVRDLWPEFPIQMGAIRNKTVIGALKIFERNIYKFSSHIIALSPGMKDGVIAAGVAPEKVTVIPNMAKPDLFFPRKYNTSIMQRFELDPKQFKIVYFGSMGVANGLEYLIEVAEILQISKILDVQFILAGYGSTENQLKDMVICKKLNNVKFLGKHDTYTVSELVNCCQACFVSFKNLPILNTNSPNKFFDSLSAGKPIIVNSSGWTKDLILENECGVYVNPNDPKDFVTQIIAFKDRPEILAKWSSNARNLSLSTFDKEVLSAQFVKIIEAHV